MFGSTILDRRSKSGRIADQAWERLASAVNSAGASAARSARHTTSQLAEAAGDRVGSVTDEARQRASAAFDALAGRRAGRQWTWIIGAGLVGAAVGWSAGTAARAAITQSGDEPGAANGRDRVEFVDVNRPGTPASLDT